MNETIRLLLVDDCPTLRAGLRQVFQHTPDIAVVGEAGDGRGALAHIESLHPEVVLLDCQMPGMEGAEVAAAVQRMCLQTNILAFSAYDDEEHVRGMLEAGAVGYLLKDEVPERVVEAVRAVADGKGWFSPAIARRIAAWVQRGQSGLPKLTGRELAVLRLLAKGKTNNCIAEELSISERTVRFHLRNINDKIGVHSRTEAVVWAVQHQLTGKA
jgi:Response regulator containing a CheY-like receiver domain and an HTH DNA-binding domain